MNTKKCCRCGEEKSTDAVCFVPRKRAKDGLTSYCRLCHNDSRRVKPKLPSLTRTCTSCGQALPNIEEYFYRSGHKRNDGSYNLSAICKPCHLAKDAAWSKANRDKKNSSTKRSRSKAVRDEKWYKSRREGSKRWYLRHKDRNRAKSAKRKATRMQAMPKWVDNSTITAFYTQARLMTLVTGVEHHVDHIDPLRHPLVCGLHAPTNLRVITDRENKCKGNSFSPYGFDGHYYDVETV